MYGLRNRTSSASEYPRLRALFLGVALIAFPLIVVASPVQVPNEFSSGETIVASEFNQNFEALANAINDNDSRIGMLEGDVMGVAAVPSGAVMFFELDQCPSGWTALPELRGRTVVGMPVGGSLSAIVGDQLDDEGLRTISEVPAHSHSVDPPAASTNSTGTHSHAVDPPSTGTSSHNGHVHAVNPPAKTTTSAGNHSHSINPPATNTTVNGNHTHTVDNGNGGVSSSHLQAANSLGDGSVADSSQPIKSAGSHSHTVDIGGFSSASSGTHSHSVDIGQFNSGSAGNHSHSVNIGQFNSGSGGNHNHSVNIGQFNSGSAGVNSVDVTMPYMQLLPCIKD